MIRYFADRVYQSVLDRLSDYGAVNLAYFRHFLTLPNLKHPKAFNEKIAWRKLYQHNPQFTVFSDKVAVKTEIATLIGEQHIIETIWAGGEPEEIPFDDLEPPYVVKVNHSSGGNVFIRSAQDLERAKVIVSMRELLGFSHGRMYREWAYGGIPHRVMVERLIAIPDGGVPEDYKFFTYHGCVHFIQLDRDRFRGHRRNLYDREWNLLPVRLSYPPISEPVSKPENLGEMINLAEKVGAQFDFVRVDLYSPPQGILFGETTFYPEAGLGHFCPRAGDYVFGEPWKLL